MGHDGFIWPLARQVAAEKGAANATEVPKGWVRIGSDLARMGLLVHSPLKNGGYRVTIFVYDFVYSFLIDFWMFQDLKYCIPVAGRFSPNLDEGYSRIFVVIVHGRAVVIMIFRKTFCEKSV